MGKFKAPEPVPFERHDYYLERLIEAFEQWVNDRFEVAMPSQPADTVTLRPFDINSYAQTADDMREILRAALESGDDSHVLSVVRDLVSGGDG